MKQRSTRKLQDETPNLIRPCFIKAIGLSSFSITYILVERKNMFPTTTQ